MIPVFVLAGGIGERFQPYTELLPKCMMPIRGKPAVRYIVDALLAQQFPPESIWLCVQNKDLEHYIHEFRDVDLMMKTSNQPMGTAGEVYAVRKDIKEDFMVIYGDDLTFRDYRTLLVGHEKDAMVTLAMTDNFRMPVGTVGFNPETNIIHSFTEKPTGLKPMWTGVGVFAYEVLTYMRKQLFRDFAQDVFPAMLADKKLIRGYLIHDPWISVGNIQQWRQANRDLDV